MPADSESRRSKPLALSASQVKRFYYTTTTAEAFPWKEISETSRGENFIDVHGIGQRTGKYFKYQKKRAPLLDRSSVYYYTDYVVLPLDDAPVTKALAKENKLRSSPGFASTTAAIFDDSTANKDAFHGFSRKEASRARQKSCKPKAGRTTTLPTGDLLEKRSVTHEAFGLPVRFPSEAAKPPMPNLFLGIRSYPPSTSYKAEFTDPHKNRRPASAGAIESRSTTSASRRPATAGAPRSRASTASRPVEASPAATPVRKRCQSAPARGRTGSSETDKLRWQQEARMLVQDEDILKMRRVCYMSPGQ